MSTVVALFLFAIISADATTIIRKSREPNAHLHVSADGTFTRVRKEAKARLHQVSPEAHIRDVSGAIIETARASTGVAELLRVYTALRLSNVTQASNTTYEAPEHEVFNFGTLEPGVLVLARRAVFGASMVLTAIFMLGKALPFLPKPVVNLGGLVIYVCISICIDLLILSQKSAGASNLGQVYKFNPLCAIILTESVKLVVAVALYAANRKSSGETLLPDIGTCKGLWVLAAPALLYTFQNILVFLSFGGNDASVIGVFRDSMIIWTALIWCLVFRLPLGKIRCAGIAVSFLGLVMNRSPSALNNKWSWGFLYILSMTLCNACGSVANEYALKLNRDVDINLTNAVLYVMCFTFAVVVLACVEPAKLHSATAFFEGFTSNTALMISLQACAGMVVACLLRYTDAIYKTIGSTIRGPCLVFIAPFVFHTELNFISLVSAFVVASGGLTYLTQGPLKVPDSIPNIPEKTIVDANGDGKRG